MEKFEKVYVDLPNGTSASLIFDSAKLKNGHLLPLIIIIHGGPFASSNQDSFSMSNSLLLNQGFGLLIINYKGSTGYGKDQMESLLGKISQNDVKDCFDIIDFTIQRHSEIINKNKIGVFGGSHGGFIAAILIGNKEYNKYFNAACLYNPVLDLSFMVSSTDIPDWVYACAFNEKLPNHITSEIN